MSDEPTISRPRTRAASLPPNTCSACCRPRSGARSKRAWRASQRSRARSHTGRSASAGLPTPITPVTPPAQSWLRIEAALSAPATAPMAPRSASLWESLAFWRGFGISAAGLATAAIAAFAYLAIMPPPQPQPETALAAARDALGHQDQAAEFRRHCRRRRHEPHHRAGGAAHRRQALDGIVADPAGRHAALARTDRARPADPAQHPEGADGQDARARRSRSRSSRPAARPPASPPAR